MSIATMTTPRRGRPRAERPSAEQVLRCRNEDWRRWHDDGCPGPDGRRSRRPVALIAALAGCSETTVRQGIAAARAIREALRHVLPH